MAVCKARSTLAPSDSQAKALLCPIWSEEGLEVGQHAVNGVPVEQQEGIVVTDGVHTPKDLVLRQPWPPATAITEYVQYGC